MKGLNMRQFYYKFKWIILANDEYYLLQDNHPNINFDLKYIDITQEDFIYANYVLGVDTEEDFLLFKELIGSKLRIKEWIPISQPNDELLNLPNEYDRFKGMYANEQFSMIDRIIFLGRLNQSHLDWLDEKQPHLYFSCNWLLTPDTLVKFRHVYDYSVHEGLLLYLLMHKGFEGECVTKEIGLRVPSKDRLHQFMNEASRDIELIDWIPISQEEFYKGQKFAGWNNIERFMDTNKTYAEANIQLGCANNLNSRT